MCIQGEDEIRCEVDEFYIYAVEEVFNSLSMLFEQRHIDLPSNSQQYVSIYDIDLESVASSFGVFGITDPIGQLAIWFYDRLREVSSFFSSVVDTLIRPVKDVVDRIWSYITTLPSAVVSGVRSLIDALQSYLSSISSFVSYIWSYLQEIGRIVSDSVRGFFDIILSSIVSIGSSIASLFDRVWSYLQNMGFIVASSVKGFFDWLWTNIQLSVSRLQDFVKGSIDYVWSGIQSIGIGILDSITKVYEFIKNIGSIVASSVKGFFDWLWTGIQSGLKSVQDFFKSSIDALWSGIQTLFRGLSDLFTKMWDVIRNIGSIVATSLKGFFDSILAGLNSLGSSILSTLSKVWEGIQTSFRGISDLFARVWDGIQSVGRWLWDGIQTYFRNLVDLYSKLWDGIQGIGKWLWDGINTYFRNLINVYTMLWEGIQGVGRWLWDGFQGVGRSLNEALSRVGSTILSELNTLGSALYGFTNIVMDGFVRLGESLSSLGKIFDKWATALMGGVNSIIGGMQQFINFTLNLPTALQNAFRSVIDFFTGVKESFEKFIRDPSRWFRENIVEPIWNGLVWLGGKIFDALKAVWDWLSKGFAWIGERIVEGITAFINWVKGGIKWFINTLSSGISWMIEAFKDIGMKMYEPFVNMFRWITSPHSPDMVSVAYNVIKNEIVKMHSEMFRIKPPLLSIENVTQAWITTFLMSIPMFMFFTTLSLPIKGIGHGLTSLGKFIEGLSFRLKLTGEPLGVGGSLSFMLMQPIAKVMGEVGKELSSNANRLVDPLWLGIGFWFGRSITPMFTYYLRNFIPLEYPTYKETEEMFLRARAADVVPRELGSKGADIATVLVDFMKIRGYSDYIVKTIFADVDEFYLTIVDRFKTVRKIPLADVWKIPSPSDLITMMIRDVIIEPEQFKKILKAVGYSDDVAALYYMLHFKYPSPEKLAQFYWRGVAGVLWYDQTLEEPHIKAAMRIEKVARKPIELNFDVKTLGNMMMSYMKWHDYAPFAWEDNFPTDKSIYMELTADLPDKVDFRWMARWGIIDHLSKLGVTMKTSIHDIVRLMARASGRETAVSDVTPEIKLDVSLLARFLEAKGIHPYFASIAAVAEAHTMLSDEMTLLRTGFIELFRWGLSDLRTVEQLMSGLFVVTFTTGYISASTGEPVTYIYNKPLYWLPAERRLLELRAVMDRAYELWRLIVREASSGVMRLALRPSDARRIVEEYGELLKSAVARQVKSLTGVDWSPTIDSEYIDLWIKYGEIMRDVESRTWIRHYATRLIAWIIYRTSYGWTPIEKFAELTSILVSRGWLTEEEKKFLDEIASWVYGIVRREMIPTPLQLATFSEYMKVDDKIVARVLDEHRVPDEYRDLYVEYIKVKWLKSDYKTYLNRARRALVLGAISRDEWDVALRQAVEVYGFRKEEIAVLEMIAELEERIELSRMWKPSLLTLSTIAEYVPEIIEKFDEIKTRYRIDPLFEPYIYKYVRIRPFIDDIRVLVSSYYRALRYTDIPKDLDEKVNEYFKEFGLTEKEKEIRKLAVQLSEIADDAREKARISVPTPSVLASLSEHIHIPREVVEYSIKLHRIPDEPIEKTGMSIADIWRKYIEVRPIVDEVKKLVDAYYRFREVAAVSDYTIPEQLTKTVMDYAKKYGFTDEELTIRRIVASINSNIDFVRDMAKEYIPTPYMLATIYEYVPSLSDKDIEMALRKRHVPEDWLGLWMRYIKSRPIADEVRAMVSVYYRMKRYSYIYGQTIPRDVEDEVVKYMNLIGFTETEKAIRALTAYMEALIDEWKKGDVVPTLSVLASMAEYIDVPADYIENVIKLRRIEKTYAYLWKRYIYVRSISAEVNRVVSAFTALYTRYAVPEDVVKKVRAVMVDGGWTAKELSIFDLELELRRGYRIITMFVPTIRQFIYDGTYLPSYEQIFSDILATYGIDVEKYKKQIDYYKTLLKNRRIWRHFSWYRTQLTYAYMYGAMDEKKVREKLQRFVDIGIIDKDEVDMIVDGIKIRGLAEIARRART